MDHTETWERLGPVLGPELCGYTHEGHTYVDGDEVRPLKCIRAPGHAGATVAVDMHLASHPDGPAFFGDPLSTDDETGELIPWVPVGPT